MTNGIQFQDWVLPIPNNDNEKINQSKPLVFEVKKPREDVYLLNDITQDDEIYDAVWDLIEAVHEGALIDALLAEIFTDRFKDIMEKNNA